MGDEAGADRGHAPSRRGEIPARTRRRRRILAVALSLLAVGLVVYILLGPVTRLVESRRNLSRAETQLAEERSRTAALEERKAWGMTDTFVELEARKMGFVKPGEIPIIVLDYRGEETNSGGTDDNPGP